MSQLQATRFNSSCAICYNDYADGDILNSPDKCGHLFHKECLEKWLLQKQECPTCRCTISVAIKQATPITLPRSTPNIYGSLDLMETLYLFNLLQALVRPLEKKPHLYDIAHTDFTKSLAETFKVSKGRHTAQQLYNQIIASNINNYRCIVIDICKELYEALLNFIPKEGFTHNELVRENYFRVCAIPVIERFRDKYLNAD